MIDCSENLASQSHGSRFVGYGLINNTGDMFKNPDLPHTDWQQRSNISSFSVQVQNSTATMKKRLFRIQQHWTIWDCKVYMTIYLW